MSKPETEQLKTESAPKAKATDKVTVELECPIVRGKEEIASIILSKPDAQKLLGVNLVDLMQMDVQSLIKVLPRITEPKLIEMEIRRMDPADLVQCGVTVSSFLLKKSAKEEASLDM